MRFYISHIWYSLHTLNPTFSYHWAISVKSTKIPWMPRCFISRMAWHINARPIPDPRCASSTPTQPMSPVLEPHKDGNAQIFCRSRFCGDSINVQATCFPSVSKATMTLDGWSLGCRCSNAATQPYRSDVSTPLIVDNDVWPWLTEAAEKFFFWP